MREIEYTTDPDDDTGRRCEEVKFGVVCRRKKGHPNNTTVQKILKDEDGAMIEEYVVLFDHRGMAGGRYYTW